ncbi:MAG: sodium-dependent transporter [Synergistaceae bacterium]|nr:sodium-dependent transporter [Synergistaceae bacterium]
MAEIKQGGDQFGSRWGLIATVLGMAVGTGNIWRFPREVAGNNGGAFILICFLALFVWAVPLICAESVFGKKTRMANAGAFKVLLGDNWAWVGAWCAMVCVMLGCYYVVVLGWVMKYLSLIFTGFLTQVQAGGTELTSEVWKNFAMTPPATEAWMWFVAAVLIAAAIISRGVQGGIEKANKIMIPSVFILLAILLVRVLMLPGAWKGLEYMYHIVPADFANPRVWLAAFTQAAWSSGAGWGMFHVYFVYAAKDEDIMLNAFTATFGDMVAAMLAGMVVLPAVFALAPDPMAVMKSGANGLTFVNLTNLFAHTTGGFLMAVLFFIALFSAALSSVIAMVELGCRNLMDMGFSRPKATVFVTAFFLIVGTWSALDNGIFENQDMVWGVALLMVGLFYSIAAMKFGVEKLWKDDIEPCSDMHVKWMWTIIKLFPAIFAFVWGWWVWDAASWYPGEWFKFWPLQKYAYTPGSMVVEWALLAVILFALNGAMAKKLVHSNKID